MVRRSFDPSLANAIKSDVKYHLFTSPEDVEGTYYTEDNIAEAEFNRDWDSKFVIHGWMTNENSPWYKPMKDAYFARSRNHNVFYVDWSKAGNLSYPVSSANTIPVGKYIAEFIVKAKLDLNKVHIIGHSLGSHLAASIGKHIFEHVGKKIFRITGTDPAGPLFESIELKYRLNKDDAQFVDVVHTDIGHYGYTNPLGHVDYYPNSGKEQPECPSIEEDDNCSHAQSNLFYIKSIKGTKYEARLAKSWRDYLEENYLTDEVFIFGEDISTHARGSLYLKI